MTESERIEVLREFMESAALGIPILWWMVAFFVISLAGMIWIALR